MATAHRFSHRAGHSPTRRHRSMQIPRPDVVHTLIARTDERSQPVLAATIAVAATTGLRRKELAGLRRSDVDLEHHHLHVRRAIRQDLDGSWTTGAPKTHQAQRVALDTFTMAVFELVRTKAVAWASDARAAVADENG